MLLLSGLIACLYFNWYNFTKWFTKPMCFLSWKFTSLL